MADVVAACGSYTWIDGNTYTSDNNVATYTYSGVVGNCDSIVTLDLTINTIDTAVSISNTTLTSNATGATYQWLDCNDNNSPIAGETNSSFTPTANGNYAVAVTQNGCVDTSAYISVTVVGIMTHQFADYFSYYPNPTTVQLHIEHETNESLNISITDQLGRVLRVQQLHNELETIDLSNLPLGIYFLSMDNGKERVTQKIIKQ